MEKPTDSSLETPPSPPKHRAPRDTRTWRPGQDRQRYRELDRCYRWEMEPREAEEATRAAGERHGGRLGVLTVGKKRDSCRARR